MKKIGIVLGGGGAKGAFQIGALEQLMAKIKDDGDQLVAVSGTSIGAMNGAFVASGQFDLLKKIWLGFTEKNCPLIQSGKLGPVAGLFLRGYSYKSEPVYKFFKDNLDVSALVRSNIEYCNTRVCLSDGATLLGGTFTSACAETKKDHDIISEIMASMSAIPLVPSVPVYGENCVDGGFRDTIPVKALLSTAGKLDVVYVITCNPTNRVAYPKNLDNTVKSLWSKIKFVYNDILWDEISRNDIELGKLKHWGNKEYHVVAPAVLDISSIEFSSDKIRKAIAQGTDTFNKGYK